MYICIPGPLELLLIEESGLRFCVPWITFHRSSAYWLEFMKTPPGSGTEWGEGDGWGFVTAFNEQASSHRWCIPSTLWFLTCARCALGTLMLVLFVLDSNFGWSSLSLPL